MLLKVEHVVDLDTGAILADEVHPGDKGESATGPVTLDKAIDSLIGVMDRGPFSFTGKDVVADRGYHSDKMLAWLAENGHRSYIPEPQRKRRNWQSGDEEQPCVVVR